VALEPDLSRFQPIDNETVAVNGLTALTQAKAGLAYLAEIVCEANPIRYTKAGAAPTAANGILVGQGEKFYLWHLELMGFLAINTGAAATLQVHYYIPRAGTRFFRDPL